MCKEEPGMTNEWKCSSFKSAFPHTGVRADNSEDDEVLPNFTRRPKTGSTCADEHHGVAGRTSHINLSVTEAGHNERPLNVSNLETAVPWTAAETEFLAVMAIAYDNDWQWVHYEGMRTGSLKPSRTPIELQVHNK
jgi:hypothetical protein